MTRSSGPADAYIRFYETLSPDTLSQLEILVTENVHFRDPFNDVTGIEPMRRVLAKMFEDLPDACFAITDVGFGEAAYLRWRFNGGRWSADGVSEVAFDADGRVTSHLDHWDSGRDIYAKLPVIGTIVRAICRRIAA